MGGPRYGGRNGYSPSPRNDRGRSPPRYRSRSRKGGGKGGKPMGRHKLTVENLPDDMSWQELKDLAIERGPSLTFARTFQYRNVHCGMVEFQHREDAEAVFRELDDRRIEGSRDRLRVSYGDLSLEQGAQRYPGRDDYRGKGYHGRDGRYDDRYDRDGDRGRRGYDDGRRRDDRSPPRGNAQKDDEPIMTLFLMDLPDDARDGEVLDDLEPHGATRVVIMNRGNETSAFVRFGSVDDAERAMDQISSGKVKVCQQKVRADMARRNTRP